MKNYKGTGIHRKKYGNTRITPAAGETAAAGIKGMESDFLGGYIDCSSWGRLVKTSLEMPYAGCDLL